jgi:hypothetical protein
MVGPLPLRWDAVSRATGPRAAAHNYIREEPAKAVKTTSLVGLDVHARQTHAAVLDLVSGEPRVCRVRLVPDEVVSFLASLPAPVLAGV